MLLLFSTFLTMNLILTLCCTSKQRWLYMWKQIQELEESNSKLIEEVQTLKTDIESKESNELELQERISELDDEISMQIQSNTKSLLLDI